MKIKGVDRPSIRNEAVVTLERDNQPNIELTIRALSPMHPDEAQAELPDPKPKSLGPLKDKKRPVFHPETGRPAIMYDEEDPTYKSNLARMGQLRAVKMVVDALDPTEVQFEAVRDGMTPEQYYDAVRKEMGGFGISIGDINHLAEEVAAVSGIDLEDVRRAKEDFTATGD